MAAWLALGLAVLVIADQVHYWSTDEDFSFGYLVPVFVGFVLNERWPLLRSILVGGDGSSESTPQRSEDSKAGAWSFFAAIMVCGSLILFLYGGFLRAVTGPDTDSAAALGLGLGGFVLAMGFLVSRTDAQGHGVPLRRRGRVVALLVFPALAWMVSAPLMLMFGTRVKLVLLEWVVQIVSNLFNALGFEILRNGSTLVLPHGVVGVADACSGIRSLTACLFAGSFLAAVFMDRTWKKILLLGMSAVLAFGMNIVRSLFLTGWAYAYNRDGFDAIEADFWGHPEFLADASKQLVHNPDFRWFSVHDFAGYLVLGLTLAGLLLLLPILNYKIKLPEDAPEQPSSGLNETPPPPSAPPVDRP